MNGIRWSVLEKIQTSTQKIFVIFSQNVENRQRKWPIERKKGVTECKVIATTICPNFCCSLYYLIACELLAQ